MPETVHPELERLITSLEQAVLQHGACTDATVAAVQKTLTASLLRSDWLPESCRKPVADCYARHLVHSDAEDRFSVVAMVWNAGQCTPVHDHSGVWCVEGVYEGRIAITRYDLIERLDGGRRARFRRHDEILEGVGATGALIPPYEYHVIENPDERHSITVHVYGCDMKGCRVYLPREDGSYEVCEKSLEYTSVWNLLGAAPAGRA
jgi:3-mercaptopropionate dioxygenase